MSQMLGMAGRRERWEEGVGRVGPGETAAAQKREERVGVGVAEPASVRR